MNLFSSPAMAEGYANSRPPVHPLVVERIRNRIASTGRFATALDVGCGAGLSTRPLQLLAKRCIGVEPVKEMLPFARQVAPGAFFVAGRAEALPVRSGSIDVLTAAGSLNYVDLDRFFPEADRVLHRDGVVVVYDFVQGRSFVDSDGLDHWFDEFQRRYPPPRADARFLDPLVLASVHAGWRVREHEPFDIPIPLTADFYSSYAMTETNVAAAVSSGAPEEGIRRWCRESIARAFGEGARDVVFRGYIAYLVRS